MASAQINGIELFYEDSDPTNEGGKPVVFWNHGAGGNHMSWWQQVPEFRATYRCIAMDHRGFGRSLDTTGEGVARFIDDLEALVDHLGVAECSIVAQSMGGRASLGFAVRHPERVKALVMADTWGFFDWPEQQERARAMQPAVTTPLVHRALADHYQEAMRWPIHQMEELLQLPNGITGWLMPASASDTDVACGVWDGEIYILGIKDRRTGVEISTSQKVLDGELDALIDAVASEDQARLLAATA